MNAAFFRHLIAVVLCVIVFCSVEGIAQDAMVAGLIVDSKGARIPSTIIHVVSRNRSKDFASDEEGFFKGTIPPGRYTVTVEKIGFWPRSIHIYVRANAVTSLNFILRTHNGGWTKCPKGVLCL